MKPNVKQWIVTALVCMSVGCAYAVDAQPPVIQAVTAAQPPVLDGVLDDACWQGLPEYTQFTCTATRKLVSPQTVVRVCCDKKNIYVAFHALHPDPKNIEARETKRNNWPDTDDFVYVAIDSTHSHRGYSAFLVNALGTQCEDIEGGSADKVQWRGDWSAGAKIVDDGYNVEMAIPYTLLKYNKNQDTFGICFERRLPVQRNWSSWPDVHGKWDMHFFADLTGLSLPWSAPRPVAMSYVTSGSSGGVGHARGGLDVKYPFTNDMLGLVTLYPDFGNVEQQVESVDFSYTERGLADSRPFFQEWNIDTRGPLFYSRHVGDFDAGLRLVGKKGRDSFGLMNARDIGRCNDTLLRYIRDIGSRSHVGVGFADHIADGPRNNVFHLSGNAGWIKGKRTHDVRIGAFESSTEDVAGGAWRDIRYSTDGGSGSFGGYVGYTAIDPTFNSYLGLIPEVDKRGWGSQLYWYKDYLNKRLHYLEFSVSNYSNDHYSGDPFLSGYTADAYASIKGGYSVSFGINKSNRDQYRDYTRGIYTRWNRNAYRKIGEAGYDWGNRTGGKYTRVFLRQMFPLSSRLAVDTLFEDSHINPPSEFAGVRRQFISTLSYDLSNERRIGGRIVRRLGDTNMYFYYRQQLRRGMDAYIVYGEPNATETTGKISFKLVQPLF